ncbi:MAG: hypothetical protein JNM17_39260 [Archangium sp.]|nr:hypothetical protein [Archangium sp.]
MNTILAMHYLLAVIENRLRPMARARGFTIEDLPVMRLVYLNARGPDTTSVTASGIAETIGRSRQSVDQSLRRLERRDLVECWKRDNGWVGGWGATSKGELAWIRLHEDLCKAEEFVFNTDEKARSATNFLRDVRHKVEDATWLLRKLRYERKAIRELAELRPGERLSEESLRELTMDAEKAYELREDERDELRRLQRKVDELEAERLELIAR